MNPYPPEPPTRHTRTGGGGRHVLIPVMAVLAAVALAAVGTEIWLLGRPHVAGPDAYAGSYPAYSPTPAWTPKGPPAGPLRQFTGRRSRVVGQVVDHTAGLAYARLAAPWQPLRSLGTDTAGLQYTVETPRLQRYAAIGSHPLDRVLAPAVTGPTALRAAAELSAAEWAKKLGATRVTPIAGQAMRVSGRPAWLAGYRVPFTGPADGITERIIVAVAVNTGRALPGVMEAAIGRPRYAMLPDINTVVASLRAVR